MNKVPTVSLDINTLRIFRCGKWFHQGLQSLLPQHQSEVEFTRDDVHGFADTVTEDTVAEMKTINQWGYRLMVKDGYKVEEDRPEHVLQVTTYGWALNKPHGLLVYINKESLDIREFPIDIAKYLPMLYEELSNLRTFWETQTLPEAEPRLYKGRECRYCQYRQDNRLNCIGKPIPTKGVKSGATNNKDK